MSRHSDPALTPSRREQAIRVGPFITRRKTKHANGVVETWVSRRHRKGLEGGDRSSAQSTQTAPIIDGRRLNRWIAAGFSVGSLLFLAGSVACCLPKLAAQLSINESACNRMFFLGSLPFTGAAFLQLVQSALAADSLVDPPRNALWLRMLGWFPDNAGWVSCVLQLAGTLLFNISTFDALLPGLTWLQQDLLVWSPDLVGSLLFLASGYVAYVEVCHSPWAWRPADISWWVVAVNLVGCLAFLVSAGCAVVLSGQPVPQLVFLASLFTAAGAACFLVGAFLMLVEDTE